MMGKVDLIFVSDGSIWYTLDMSPEFFHLGYWHSSKVHGDTFYNLAVVEGV